MQDKPKYDPLRKIDTREQYVMLECTSFKCKYLPDGVVLGVPRSNYVHGSYKCEKCGKALVIKKSLP